LYQLFLFATIFNFLFAPFYLIYLPFIVNKLIKVASGNLAYIQSAYAFGAILGAIVMMRRSKERRLSRIVINGLWLSDILIAGLLIPILPCVIGKTAVWVGTLYLVGLLLLIGVCASLINIPVGVIFQKMVPDEVLGRVGGMLGSIVSAALPLGYLVGGVIAEVFPLYLVITITVILLLLLTALMESNKCIREF
jgi:DHA3 family macrolide efflux protein-like MFS transporter